MLRRARAHTHTLTDILREEDRRRRKGTTTEGLVKPREAHSTSSSIYISEPWGRRGFVIDTVKSEQQQRLNSGLQHATSGSSPFLSDSWSVGSRRTTGWEFYRHSDQRQVCRHRPYPRLLGGCACGNLENKSEAAALESTSLSLVATVDSLLETLETYFQYPVPPTFPKAQYREINTVL